MTKTLEKLVGSKLVLGIQGTTVTDETIRQFQETHAGGLILFRRNFETASSFQKIIRDLENALGRRLVVMIDHESGRVIHLPEGVTFFPDNLAARQAGDEALVEKQGVIEARELSRFGFDLVLSPVLDVLTEKHSPNIGIRSYGRNPKLVARLGAARILGLQSQGLSACAKHFPGLGAATLDPHLSLPVIEETWETMRACHLKPFQQAIKAGVRALMSSHPLYPKLDPAPQTPATFSKALMTDLLRKELGFKGLLLSDDLEMGAIQKNLGMEEAARRTAEAGHDLILCCSDPALQKKLFQSLIESYQKKVLSSEDLEASAGRIQAFRKHHSGNRKFGDPQPEPKAAQVAKRIAKSSIQIFNPPRPLPGVKRTRTLVLFPDLTELSQKFAVEPAFLTPSNFRKTFLDRYCAQGNGISLRLIPFHPSGTNIAAIESESHGFPRVLYFCWDAHLNEGCRKLLDRLQKKPEKLTVVLLRNPYDAEFVSPGVSCLTAFGFRGVQIKAVFRSLFKNKRLIAMHKDTPLKVKAKSAG